MERETVALILSIVSLFIAVLSLGWNVYREIALRAQVKTALAIGEYHSDGAVIKKIYITAANRGPGPVQIQGFKVDAPKKKPFNVRYHVVPVDWDDPLTTRLPALLTVGQTAQLVVSYRPDLFLAGGATRIGLTDSFGRTHWTPRRDGKRARDEFRRDFPGAGRPV